MKIGRLLLRATVGGFFVGHGTQKLLGWFGGPGLEATAQGFHQMGMRPGRRNAIAAGISETAGGAAIALGFATPLAASALIGTMLTAINRVHLKNGPWASKGGYEYNVVLIAALLALVEVGPGDPSLDDALGLERSGPEWAALALVAGAVGAAGAHLLASLEPQDEAPAPSADGPSPASEPSPATSTP
ncbi:MAG TPA: DoxX family protein [Solirubrobacteraceae bacterium]|jgi:putative oxidoreductase